MKCEVNIPTKINKCCDPDNGRLALGGIQVVPVTQDKGEDQGVYLIATDSRRLVIINAEGTADSRCLIPGDLSPKTKKELTGTVKYFPDPEDEEKPGHWTRLEYKTKLSQRSVQAFDEGLRFPRVSDCIPEMTNRHIAVTINAKYLYECWEAMNDENYDSDNNNAITLFLEVPRTQSLLPDTEEIVHAIDRLKDEYKNPEEGNMDWATFCKKHLITLALNCNGDWNIESYLDVNHFHAAVMGKYDYYNEVQPHAEDTSEEIAYQLIEPVRKQFEAKQLLVESPIAVMAGQNFGVLMPLAHGHDTTDFESKRKRFVESYLASDTPLEATSEPVDDDEFEDESEVTEEPEGAEDEPVEEYMEPHGPVVEVEVDQPTEDIDLDSLCDSLI